MDGNAMRKHWCVLYLRATSWENLPLTTDVQQKMVRGLKFRIQDIGCTFMK